ncbi:hypothetical protein PMAC_000426 [Pneumocystis sp. 'macacae']|nr:hypothetical protein PMAC_000426 [Pneumocystis sp. 'macacae']
MNDPWERREAWRSQYPFKTMRINKMFPGLGLGVGSFVIYCLFEKFWLEKSPSEKTLIK